VQLAGEAEYGRLLDAGVRISCFQPSMLHAKVMTVDGVVSMVGSANFNTRSVSWDEEIEFVVIDPDLTAVLDGQFDDDLDRSIALERGRWHRRSSWQRAAEAVVRPVKHWF
jgi:cardiolipin synthase